MYSSSCSNAYLGLLVLQFSILAMVFLYLWIMSFFRLARCSVSSRIFCCVYLLLNADSLCHPWSPTVDPLLRPQVLFAPLRLSYYIFHVFLLALSSSSYGYGLGLLLDDLDSPVLSPPGAATKVGTYQVPAGDNSSE